MSRSAILATALIAASCSQHATTPRSEILAPSEWTPTMASPLPTAPTAISGSRSESSSVEDRLRRVSELQEKGVITSEEAKRTREHILRDL